MDDGDEQARVLQVDQVDEVHEEALDDHVTQVVEEVLLGKEDLSFFKQKIHLQASEIGKESQKFQVTVEVGICVLMEIMKQTVLLTPLFVILSLLIKPVNTDSR